MNNNQACNSIKLINIDNCNSVSSNVPKVMKNHYHENNDFLDEDKSQNVKRFPETQSFNKNIQVNWENEKDSLDKIIQTEDKYIRNKSDTIISKL